MAITNEFSISKVNYDGVVLLLGIRLLNIAKKGKNNNSRRKSKLSQRFWENLSKVFKHF